MKDYIEERAIDIANYIIENNTTVRQTAKQFGISKSTVHKDLTERLSQINESFKKRLYRFIKDVDKYLLAPNLQQESKEELLKSL